MAQAPESFDPAAAIDPGRAMLPAVVRVNTTVVKRGFWPKIRKFARQLPFVEDAVALWVCARDPATPMTTKAMLMASLAYFVVPTDVLPDWFAGLGFTDDAAVITAAVALAGRAITAGHRGAAKALLDRFAAEK